jgi:hypothetical protein
MSMRPIKATSVWEGNNRRGRELTEVIKSRLLIHIGANLGLTCRELEPEGHTRAVEDGWIISTVSAIILYTIYDRCKARIAYHFGARAIVRLHPGGQILGKVICEHACAS